MKLKQAILRVQQLLLQYAASLMHVFLFQPQNSSGLPVSVNTDRLEDFLQVPSYSVTNSKTRSLYDHRKPTSLLRRLPFRCQQLSVYEVSLSASSLPACSPSEYTFPRTRCHAVSFLQQTCFTLTLSLLH